jgi:hypothetical protein
MSGDGEQSWVSGGHVPEPTPLADILEVLEPTRFRLLGRSNDLINVAGKRSSLAPPEPPPEQHRGRARRRLLAAADDGDAAWCAWSPWWSRRT